MIVEILKFQGYYFSPTNVLFSYNLSLGPTGEWSKRATSDIAQHDMEIFTYGQLVNFRGSLLYLTDSLQSRIFGYQIPLNQPNESSVEWKKIEFPENSEAYERLQTATQVYF